MIVKFKNNNIRVRTVEESMRNNWHKSFSENRYYQIRSDNNNNKYYCTYVRNTNLSFYNNKVVE